MSNYLNLFKLASSSIFKRGLPQRTLYQSTLRLQKATEDPSYQIPKVENKLESVHAQQNVSSADHDLLQFLTNEIIEERRVQMELETPYTLDGFKVVFRGSEIELSKEIRNERINIFFNVSKSVPRRPDQTGVISPVRSLPRFEVLMKRGNALLSMYCTFVQAAFKDLEANVENSILSAGQSDQSNDGKAVDVFEIQEMSMYENNWNECVYTIETTLIDDCLYNLLMAMLVEKGVTNDFALKISDLATAHEHASYIGFLESLSKFAVGLPPPIKG